MGRVRVRGAREAVDRAAPFLQPAIDAALPGLVADIRRAIEDGPLAVRSRGPWVADFEPDAVVELGGEWPVAVLVSKWETNPIGERRFVASRTYVAGPED